MERPELSRRSKRQSLFKWAMLFCSFNLVIVFIISASYLSASPYPEDSLSWVYLISMTSGHFTFLVILLFLITVLPFILLLPKKALILALAVFIATVGIILLKIDTYVFAQYKFHINLFILQMILDAGDQIIGFPLQMWSVLFVASALLVIIEITLALFLWNHHLVLYKKLKPQWLLSCMIVLYFISHFIHIYADANYIRSITRLSHFYPLLLPATANKFMIRQGWGNIKKQEASLVIKNKSSLDYPLKPLIFSSSSALMDKPLNLLMILIDSWRFDMMTESVTPNIFALASQSIQYKNHFSGSNDTRNGIFSLFYGLPATYWKAFESNQLGPVMIDRMLELKYQTGIFASAPLINPEFDRTVFKQISNLQTSTHAKTANLRDIKITSKWQQWLAQQQKQEAGKPFFGVLFYDSVHAYQYPQSYPRQFMPSLSYINYFKLNNDRDPLPVINHYKNITHFVDSLVGEVIDDLQKKGLMETTVILISSDHGQEINDNKLNYWGHSGNYSRYQTQVPMMLYWPEKKPLIVTDMTTHYDIVPTLMNNLFYSLADIRSYSTGRDLFADRLPVLKRHIMGNYNSFAIFDTQKKLFLVKEFDGTASTYDYDYREGKRQNITPSVARQAIEDMSRFYKK